MKTVTKKKRLLSLFTAVAMIVMLFVAFSTQVAFADEETTFFDIGDAGSFDMLFPGDDGDEDVVIIGGGGLDVSPIDEANGVSIVLSDDELEFNSLDVEDTQRVTATVSGIASYTLDYEFEDGSQASDVVSVSISGDNIDVTPTGYGAEEIWVLVYNGARVVAIAILDVDVRHAGETPASTFGFEITGDDLAFKDSDLVTTKTFNIVAESNCSLGPFSQIVWDYDSSVFEITAETPSTSGVVVSAGSGTFSVGTTSQVDLYAGDTLASFTVRLRAAQGDSEVFTVSPSSIAVTTVPNGLGNQPVVVESIKIKVNILLNTQSESGYYWVNSTKTGAIRFWVDHNFNGADIQSCGFIYVRNSDVRHTAGFSTSASYNGIISTLIGIPSANFEDSFTAKPFIVLNDGTTCYGEAVTQVGVDRYTLRPTDWQ